MKKRFAVVAVLLSLYLYSQLFNSTITLTGKQAVADYTFLWDTLEQQTYFTCVLNDSQRLELDTRKKQDLIAMENGISLSAYYLLISETVADIEDVGHIQILSPHNYTMLKEVIAHLKGIEIGYDQMQTVFCNKTTTKAYKDLGRERRSLTTTYSHNENLSFLELGKSTAYVKINSFPMDYAKEQEILYDWFWENRNTDNIVIDVTGNSGGFVQYWLDCIVTPNIDQETQYSAYFLLSKGSDFETLRFSELLKQGRLYTDFSQLSLLDKFNKDLLGNTKAYGEMILHAKPLDTGKLCNGTMYLLIDQRSYSATDTFAAFCKDTGFATVIGRQTAGDGRIGGIGINRVALPYSGLILQYRVAYGLNVDGSSNAMIGTSPDILSTYSEKPLDTLIRTLDLDANYVNSLLRYKNT